VQLYGHIIGIIYVGGLGEKGKEDVVGKEGNWMESKTGRRKEV